MPDLMSPFETYRRPRDRADTTDTAFDDRPWLGRKLGPIAGSQDLTPQPRNSLDDPNADAAAHWRYTPGSPWEASKGAQRAEAILGAPGVNEMLFASNFLAPRPGALPLPTPAPKPQGIRAYHGSPHEFEKFSLDKIGTGEGAQAFGHGLYFAENEGVARNYRDVLALNGGKAKHGDTYYDLRSRNDISSRSPMHVDKEILAADEQAKIKDALSDYLSSTSPVGIGLPGGKKRTADAYATYNNAIAADIEKQAKRSFLERAFGAKNDDTYMADVLRQRAEIVKQRHMDVDLPKGHMYEVNINANPEHFLAWDKPLTAQPHVLKKLQEAGVNVHLPESPSETYSPQSILNDSSLYGGKGKAEAMLRDAGIPGVRYKDAGSRAAEGGTNNYVVFDDKLIEILRKYGLGGLMAGGAATQAPGLLAPSAQSPNN